MGPSAGVLSPLQLDPAVLQAHATRTTGFEDWGPDDGWREGLRQLLASAQADAQLNVLGISALQSHVVRALENRLLRQGHAVTDAPLNAPLVVCGLYRSGTTFLHRLLAQIPGARAPKLWEVQRPFPPRQGDDRRRDLTIRMMSQLSRLAPDLESKHVSGADQAEECVYLHDDTFRSMSFWLTAPAHSYLDWYARQDMTIPYQAWRQCLVWFQSQTPQARLMLKAPAHTPHLDTLLRSVPEARLVQIHRDPVTALASTNSLFSTLHSLACTRLDLPRMRALTLEMVTSWLDRAVQLRAVLPAHVICDVRYDDLVRDPVQVVRDIHAHFGQPFSAAAEEQVRRYALAHPRGARGAHHYSLDDLGVGVAQLRDRFARYSEKFLSGP